MLNGKIKSNIKPGSIVKVVQKSDQKTGKLTEGIVKEILTKSSSHPFGIKVLLENGIVGRVKEVIETPITQNRQMQVSEIEQEILGQEGQKVEFKSAFGFDMKRYHATGVKATNKEMEKSIAKTVAAFLNSQVGVLYIGVDDDGNIIGLDEDYAFLEKPNSDRFRLKLKHCLEGFLRNKIIFENISIEFATIRGREICKVSVNPSSKPIFLHDRDRQECYVRVDNESAPYTPDEFFEYWQRRSFKK